MLSVSQTLEFDSALHKKFKVPEFIFGRSLDD